MHPLLFSHARRFNYEGQDWEAKSATSALLQTPPPGVSLWVLGHSSSSLRLISLPPGFFPIKSLSFIFQSGKCIWRGDYAAARSRREKMLEECEEERQTLTEFCSSKENANGRLQGVLTTINMSVVSKNLFDLLGGKFWIAGGGGEEWKRGEDYVGVRLT